jgi:hypothetical protein
LFGLMVLFHVDAIQIFPFFDRHSSTNCRLVRRQKQIWDTEESKPRSDFLLQVMMCSNAFVWDNFDCLGWVFWHKLEKHGSVFGAIAVITQLGIDDVDKLFDVSNYRS